MRWALGNQSRRTNTKTVQTEVLLWSLGKPKRCLKVYLFPLKNGGQLFNTPVKLIVLNSLVLEDQHYLSLWIINQGCTYLYLFLMLIMARNARLIPTWITALLNANELIGHSAKPAGSHFMFM